MVASAPAPGSTTAAVPAPSWPPEWWERLTTRAAVWRERHPRGRRVLLVLQLGWAGLGALWLVAAAAGFAELRPAPAVVAGCVWLLVVWFLLARTKTLTWTGCAALFAVAIPWSLAVGFASWWLTGPLGGPANPRAVVGFAAVAEESAKLIPLAVLAAIAPGRVRRFAVTDWLLAGFALGLGFTVAEEVLRRMSWVAGGGDAAQGVAGWAHFGISPFAGAASTYVPGSGTFGLMAGHQVHTALIAGAFGLGLAVWRHARRRTGLRVLGVALPALAWLGAVADHTGWNATIGQDGSSGPVAVVAVRALWALTGHGAGRSGLLLVLLVVAMLVDACALARGDPGDPLLPGDSRTSAAPAVACAGTVAPYAEVVAGRSTPALRPVVRLGSAVAVAVVLLAGYVTRDLVTTVILARRPVPDRRHRLLALLTAAWPARQAREVAYAAARSRRDTGSARRGAVLALVVLLALAGPVALGVAFLLDPTAPAAGPGDWLAGTLASTVGWWHGLPFWQQVASGGAATGLPLTTALFLPFGRSRSEATSVVPFNDEASDGGDGSFGAPPGGGGRYGSGGGGTGPVGGYGGGEGPPAGIKGGRRGQIARRQAPRPSPEEPERPSRFRSNEGLNRSHGSGVADIVGQAKNYARGMRRRGFRVKVPPPRYGKYGHADVTVTVLRRPRDGRGKWIVENIRHFIYTG